MERLTVEHALSVVAAVGAKRAIRTAKLAIGRRAKGSRVQPGAPISRSLLSGSSAVPSRRRIDNAHRAAPRAVSDIAASQLCSSSCSSSSSAYRASSTILEQKAMSVQMHRSTHLCEIIRSCSLQHSTYSPVNGSLLRILQCMQVVRGSVREDTYVLVYSTVLY